MLESLSHLNTRLKLFEKVSLLLVIMVLLAGSNIAVIYVYHQQAEQVGNSVNVAGQERMLTQRMAHLANEVDRGEDPEYARERLRIARDRFERNLDVLIDGGTVPDQNLNPAVGSDSTRTQVTLSGESVAAAPPAVEPELEELETAWTEYRAHVDVVRTADPESPAFQESMTYINRHSDRLLAISDSVTAEFAVVLRESRALLGQLLVVLLAVDIVVASLGGLAARRLIGLPMADMARAGRRLARGEEAAISETDLPIDHSLPEAAKRSELAQLSQSFRAVQAYHRTASKQAQALARRDFDDPVLDEQVPGELGRSLSKVRVDLPDYIEELRATTEKLDALVEAAPVGICIVGPNGTVKRWNPAAEQIFGWAAETVEGTVNPALPPERTDAFRQLLSSAIVDGPVTGIETAWRTKGGERVDVSLSLSPVPGPEETLEGVMVVIEDISDRKERERTLRQHRDELEMLTRVSDLVLAITQELLESSNQDRIERTVCTSLSDSPLYEQAWIGTEQANEPRLAVRAASTESMVGESIPLDAGTATAEAVGDAFEDGTIQVRKLGPETVDDHPSHEVPVPGTIAAVPLVHHGAVFGVLVVTTDREHAFEERERTGLRTLGRTVGFAIDAITDKKLLFAETVIELAFDVSETDLPLVATTRSLDCQAGLVGVVAGARHDTLDAYLEFEGAELDAILDQVAEEPGITAVRAVATDAEPYRVKLTFGADSPVTELFDRDARLRAVDLQGGSGTYTVAVPTDADIESTVDLVQSVAPAATFVAKTEQERQAVLGSDTADTIREVLTDRQYEVFTSAYFGGYFEWPRNQTIEDLAADLGIAGSTFNNHLRHAQRKIADVLFGPGEED
ncbi:bacterio-opsin activator domain-containing protein [Halodesulfurarchaeum sp. HSR-GB]|uniref:bacterio-opsin activator domain-containing protein n=1 Tax=Halodesulfurarchaeum sp. HSR-GB TaxID=3074077 RepID=UPI00285EA345|nr:bacterio-opsin activator domain-containing protein [Halodesulfurarchaeum sp. HSR-GB]MDR5656439.1 bacterio-opsin activator domain-containing protein [Halodesulfurarchaeum sp. HSR-GB]